MITKSKKICRVFIDLQIIKAIGINGEIRTIEFYIDSPRRRLGEDGVTHIYNTKYNTQGTKTQSGINNGSKTTTPEEAEATKFGEFNPRRTCKITTEIHTKQIWCNIRVDASNC